MTAVGLLRSEEQAALVAEEFLQQGLGHPLAGLEPFQEEAIRKLKDWDVETASRDKRLGLQNV